MNSCFHYFFSLFFKSSFCHLCLASVATSDLPEIFPYPCEYLHFCFLILRVICLVLRWLTSCPFMASLIALKQLLASITGTQKISVPMTIVVSGIAKMFVGDVVETARIVMKERKESGPIRPCHLREAYRRLKLEGKVFKRPASRLFR